MKQDEMINPWLLVPPEDYEKHMSAPHVGQLQVLNGITGYVLDKYKPERFAVLGCSTGNGLEHVDNSITLHVDAIDINREYLAITGRRFGDRIHDLALHTVDIDRDELKMHDVDLFHLALILEYVNITVAIDKVCRCMSKKGHISVVIQKAEGAAFVSASDYTSLMKLSATAREIDRKELETVMKSHYFGLIASHIYPLPGHKAFELLEFAPEYG
jgi:ubiquinone/menaquinone biosynthesis C-methylase UbiE